MWKISSCIFYFFILCLPGISLAGGILHTWPSVSAPCSGTLQACIDGVPAADSVQIASNTPINESITFAKPLGLIAAPSYSPIFTAGHSISATLNSPGTLYISGITLTRGQVLLAHTSVGTSAVIAEKIKILATDDHQEGIRLESFSTSILDFEIRNCIVTHHADIDDAVVHGAIAVGRFTVGASTGIMRGNVIGNSVTSLGTAAYGITVTQVANDTLRVGVAGNTIYGGSKGSIFFFNPDMGTILPGVISNLVLPTHPGLNDAGGIEIVSSGATNGLYAVNNTVIGALHGIVLTGAGANFTGTSVIANNLLSANNEGLRIPSGASANNLNNLLYNNTSNDYGASSGIITTNPLVAYLDQPRLKPSSPAIDSGDDASLNAALSAFSDLFGAVPALDADGLRRIKGSHVDIGAFESGDFSFLHISAAGNSNSNYSFFNQPTLNSNPSSLIQTVHNYNANGLAGVYNNNNLGVFYTTGLGWSVFNQNTGSAMPLNTGFNSFVPATGAFLQTATLGNITGNATLLSVAIGNNEIMLVTPNWNGTSPGSTGVYDDHVIELLYTGQWSIYHPDGASIPVGATYNVYHQPNSKNAFVHIAQNGNTINNYTYLNHPLLNGNYCAQPYVMQVNNAATPNPHPIGVFYDALFNQQWAIYNEDLAGMPINAYFHVLVNPAQASICDRVFTDWFEAN